MPELPLSRRVGWEFPPLSLEPRGRLPPGFDPSQKPSRNSEDFPLPPLPNSRLHPFFSRNEELPPVYALKLVEDFPSPSEMTFFIFGTLRPLSRFFTFSNVGRSPAM